MQDLTDRCLAADPQDRPDAATLQRALRKLMRQHLGGEDDLLDSAMVLEEPLDGKSAKGCSPFALCWPVFRSKKAVPAD